MTAPVLRLEGVTKKFGAALALDNVSIDVFPNEVIGLVGENGAGKSTLLKALAGIHPVDTGRIVVNGREQVLRSPTDARRAGIGMVFQEQSLVSSLTVAENVYLGHEGESVRHGIYRWGNLRARSAAQLRKIESQVSPAAITERLPFGARQMVEVAKALTVEANTEGPPVLLLDEPTSVLEAREIEVLFAQIERLRTIGSVIFVSHRLEEVLAVSDRIYVMRDGACVAERRPENCTHKELFELMVGQEMSEEYYGEASQSPHSDQVVLSARSLSLEGAFQEVDLELRAGEVLGLAGVQGSGRDELCRTLFGAEAPSSGTIELAGRAVTFASPAEAVSRGMGYIPAERKTEGIVAELSIADNISLSYNAGARRGPFLDRGAERRVANEWIQRLNIKANSADSLLSELSGGNQQKVALAKWLNRPHLSVLLLDHPTRGLDLGAKRDVYRLIRELAARGVAVLFLGDSLEETIAMSHNVIAMRDGRVTGIFPAPPGAKPSQVDIVERLV
jgi:ribose transport system ATP-binding protein